jgi:predicted RNA polymerase sigma factor
MGEAERLDQRESLARLEKAYRSERPRLPARLRRAGRTLEEAEGLIHDVYVETMQRLPLVGAIANLPAWINSLFKRPMIDLWRHEQVRSRSGETDVTEETLRETISGAAHAHGKVVILVGE